MNLRRFFIKTVATFFYVGYLPFIPGTFASLAAIGVFYLVKDKACVYILVTAVSIISGFLFAGEAEKIFNKKDARCIVIDEVSGMLLGLLFVPYNTKIVVIAFLLFRIFDSLKPYPVRRLEKLKGGAGIMCDDIAAGLYTNIILQAVFRVFSANIS